MTLAKNYSIVPWQSGVAVSGHTYRAEARSVVVLLASAGAGTSPTLEPEVRGQCGRERTNATIFLYDLHIMDDIPVLRHVGPIARGPARRRAIRLALGDVTRGSGRAWHSLMLSPGGRMRRAL